MDKYIHDAFVPEYLSVLFRDNSSKSKDYIYQNSETKEYLREIEYSLLPPSKFSIKLSATFTDISQAYSVIDDGFFREIRNLLISLLSRLTSISMLDDLKPKLEGDIWISNPCFYLSTKKYQDRQMYITINSEKYIQFFIKRDSMNSLIGNLNNFPNNDSFDLFIEEFMHNIGEKPIAKWQF